MAKKNNVQKAEVKKIARLAVQRLTYCIERAEPDGLCLAGFEDGEVGLSYANLIRVVSKQNALCSPAGSVLEMDMPITISYLLSRIGHLEDLPLHHSFLK